MKRSLLIALIAFSHLANADVHSIVKGIGSEPHLVKMDSGEVIFIEPHEKEKLSLYQRKNKLNKNASSDLIGKRLFLEDTAEFEPTVVADSEIQNIFNRMNSFMKRKSECSDRAHVWAYDENQFSGIKSQKAFLLLTDAYIKRTRFKWWFHVAPMYVTASGQKIVMDHQFLDRPVTFDQWKNLLVFSKRECVADFRFLDYNAGADQTQDCYVKFEPMYYRIPADIGAREQSGLPRSGWNNSEVNSSRMRAFTKRSL